MTLDDDAGDIQLGLEEGVRGLARVRSRHSDALHACLISAMYHEQPGIRIAALDVFHICAVRKPDDLLDHLAELLDDDDGGVRTAASNALAASLPIFPSGCEVLIHIELRHDSRRRRTAAWRGLRELLRVWPDAAMDHMDQLLRSEDVDLRRRAASLLRSAANRVSAIAWDLVGWALEDEDPVVRDNASRAIRTIVQHEPRQALIFAETALFDSLPAIRNRAVATLEALGAGARVSSLVQRGCRHADTAVRLACIGMLPRLLSEGEVRDACFELLRSERDSGVREQLVRFTRDLQLEGNEMEKNRFLVPSEPVIRDEPEPGSLGKSERVAKRTDADAEAQRQR